MTAIAPMTEPSPSAIHTPGRDWCAPAVVWFLWAFRLAALLKFIRRYGHNGPMWYDELGNGLIPVVFGARPLTAAWLWQPSGEHRFVGVKLILVALVRLTDDFRSGMYVSAFCLAALAFVLIRVARQVRGRTSYFDAIFPLAILNFGHGISLLQSWTLAFPAVALLAGLVLAIIARSGRGLSLGSAIGAGICLIILPFFGAGGAAFVPTLALWLAYAGILRWIPSRDLSEDVNRSGLASGLDRGRRDALFIVALAATAFALIPIFFLGIKRRDPNPPVRVFLQGSLQFLSMLFGPAIRFFWPGGGVAAVGLMAYCVGTLAVALLRRPQERLRCLGFLSFLTGLGCLTLGIGWGRSMDPIGCFGPWYSSLSILALCCAYLIGVVYNEATSGRLVQFGLLVVVCVMFIPNREIGIWLGEGMLSTYGAFEADIRRGVPISVLVDRHARGIKLPIPESRAIVMEELAVLKRAGLGVYNQIREEPPAMRTVSIPVTPTESNEMTWDDGVGYGRGSHSYLGFELGRPRWVYAIRLKCSMNYGGAESSPVNLRVSWRQSGQADFPREGQQSDAGMDTGPGEKTAVVWVDDRIDRFRIYPAEHPCVIKIAEILLEMKE